MFRELYDGFRRFSAADYPSELRGRSARSRYHKGPLDREYEIFSFDCENCRPAPWARWLKSRLDLTAYTELVDRAARTHRAGPALIRAMLNAESSFDPAAISHQGALGLMQLMPVSAAALECFNRFLRLPVLTRINLFETTKSEVILDQARCMEPGWRIRARPLFGSIRQSRAIRA